MKVLFLCKKFPYPLRDGESIAVSNLCKELKALGCDLSLLSMNTSKHYSDTNALPEDYNYFSSIDTVDIDNAIKPWKAFTSLVSGESYHIRRFRSGVFKSKLIEILSREKFDIIQLETLYLAPYVETIRQYSDARIVMRAHNVEHEIWERITQNTSSNLRKMYLAYLTRKLREYEIEQFPVYDYLITLTDRDLELFIKKGYKNGASSAPIGFESESYPYTTPSFGAAMSICFIGSLDWMPNREGLEWFLDKCWPMIHAKWPDITLHIAGRNTPLDLLSRKIPNVTMHGEVPDAAAFVNAHALMIVPLFSGSGMRVKIVEGMMMGKVIVTTAIGKEGIDGDDFTHFLIANEEKQFVKAIQYCVEHPDKALTIGIQAQQKAGQLFDSSKAAQKIYDIYQHLLDDEIHAPKHTPVSSLTP